MKSYSFCDNWTCKHLDDSAPGIPVLIPHDAMLAEQRNALAAGGMALAVWGFVQLMSGRLGNALLTLGAVALGVMIYALLAFALRALSREDLKMIPGGRRLMRLMDKVGGKKA